jgi:hypothetical protein
MALLRGLRQRAAVVIVGLLTVGLMAGCASSSPAATSGAAPTPAASAPAATTSAAPSPSPGSPPAYCAEAGQLEASLRALASTDVIGGGLDAVKAGLTKVEADLAAFAAAAQAQFGPQVTALRNALTGMLAALRAAQADLNSSTVTAVLVAGASVASAYGALRDTIAKGCG